MDKTILIETLKAGRTALSDEKALQGIELFPQWESVIGTELIQDDITNGFDRYQYQGKLYRLIQPHTPQTDWTPDQTPALWVEISLEEWPLWRQPQGAHDAYKTGDQVTWQEKHWISAMDANTYEPGVYGWTEQAITSEETDQVQQESEE